MSQGQDADVNSNGVMKYHIMAMAVFVLAAFGGALFCINAADTVQGVADAETLVMKMTQAVHTHGSM